MRKSYFYIITWMIYFIPPFLVSQPIINEFLASNVTAHMNEDFYVFSDWLEIKNPGIETINIGGYFLTDDFNDLIKWQIPENTFIGPGESRIFIADEMDLGANSVYYYINFSGTIYDSITMQYDHLNFKLSTNGDKIALVSPAGIILDSISFGEQPADVSYGRDPDNPLQWVYFSEPTPGLPNNAPSYLDTTKAETPIFSIQGGLFSGTQSVSLSVSSPIAEIHYTLDGSTPDMFSPEYSEAFEITSTSVIRARVFDPLYLPGQVITNTYIIDENSDLTIISVALNPEFLWDDTIGIYVAGVNGIIGKGSSTPKNWNQDWERPVNIELYSPQDNLEFNKQAGIKIYGFASRKGDQKPFSFYMKKKYGTDNLSYQLFKDKPGKVYKRFVLRNRGQRGSAHLKLNDVMMQSVISDVVNVDDQAYEPAVLFLNGEYWGIYSIREKLDNYYTETNFGLDPDNIDFIEHGLMHVCSGDLIHYTNMLDFLEQNDMSLDENYEYIKTQMDIDEYINYQITEIYSSNVDWPANNIKYWRPKTINGLWRWILYDIDNAFEFVSRNSLAYATEPNGPSWPNPPYSTFLFRKLLENDEFKNQFIQQFASHLNITFGPQRVIDIANSINQEIDSEKAKHATRWGTSLTMNVNSFSNSRIQYMQSFIMAEFNLASYAELTVNYNDEEGLVVINNVQVPESDFTGEYFEDIPIQVTAIAKPGYKFVEWTGISNNNSTSIIINGDSVITAIFEGSSIISDLYINEFMADNDNTIVDPQGDFDDWIEIYNSGSGIVDIGGLYITDDLAEPDKYMIPNTEPDSTSIFPGEFLLLWADKDPEDGVLHLDIKLSKDGEEIGLFDTVGLSVIDTVTFGEQSSDISFGRYPDGEQLWVTMFTPTPELPNIYYLKLEADVFLEGAFYETEMYTELNAAGLIPTLQPFNTEPWNYFGTENIISPPVDAVDWLLVELRDTTDAASATPGSVIARQAAFVLKDGTVVDLNGDSMLKFYEPIKHSLFVVIYHRNHLALMSSQSLIETDGIYSYNFTSGETNAYGGASGHTEIAGGIWGMTGGDSNADGIVNSEDKLLWQSESATRGYKACDLNLNTEINNTDKNDIWHDNQDATSQVPQ
ncbi:MAG: CotH kinase family protein [Bacteroidales bacterium]|nr:CotH kinase family protein [Bacteroidales bacterium]